MSRRLDIYLQLRLSTDVMRPWRNRRARRARKSARTARIVALSAGARERTTYAERRRSRVVERSGSSLIAALSEPDGGPLIADAFPLGSI